MVGEDLELLITAVVAADDEQQARAACAALLRQVGGLVVRAFDCSDEEPGCWSVTISRLSGERATQNVAGALARAVRTFVRQLGPHFPTPRVACEPPTAWTVLEDPALLDDLVPGAERLLVEAWAGGDPQRGGPTRPRQDTSRPEPHRPTTTAEPRDTTAAITEPATAESRTADPDDRSPAPGPEASVIGGGRPGEPWTANPPDRSPAAHPRDTGTAATGTAITGAGTAASRTGEPWPAEPETGEPETGELRSAESRSAQARSGESWSGESRSGELESGESGTGGAEGRSPAGAAPERAKSGAVEEGCRLSLRVDVATDRVAGAEWQARAVASRITRSGKITRVAPHEHLLSVHIDLGPSDNSPTNALRDAVTSLGRSGWSRVEWSGGSGSIRWSATPAPPAGIAAMELTATPASAFVWTVPD
ncbi:MAG: hypothetical protein HOV94_12175 [Saccharothrix sp.]|nr:hypothetical protein [Saccharothrix sp.]